MPHKENAALKLHALRAYNEAITAEATLLRGLGERKLKLSPNWTYRRRTKRLLVKIQQRLT